MKLTIVLKKTDADGLGGEILTTMGMSRSEHEPNAFSVMQSMTDPNDKGTESSGFAQSEMWSLMYLEALTDRGIRPMRTFVQTDSTSGLTPVAAAVEDDPIQAALNRVEAAIQLHSNND